MHLCFLKSYLSCPAVYIYFALKPAQSSGKKNKWQCESEEFFERRFVVYVVLHYSRKRFFRKELINCVPDKSRVSGQ